MEERLPASDEVIGHIVAMHLPRVASNELGGWTTRESEPYIDSSVGALSAVKCPSRYPCPWDCPWVWLSAGYRKLAGAAPHAPAIGCAPCSTAAAAAAAATAVAARQREAWRYDPQLQHCWYCKVVLRLALPCPPAPLLANSASSCLLSNRKTAALASFFSSVSASRAARKTRARSP
jgi:hypothetical protein